MGKRLKILFFYAFFMLRFTSAIIAQGEANIWYFGVNAGLDFNTDPPTPLTDGVLSTSEGCASVADKNGALVFYTDGITVWNKNHVAMPNGTGLLGNPSATQSAIIVPYPGTYNYGSKRFDKYYIVTVEYVNGPNGVRYSEVDMTLNGGLGGVTVIKNVHLYGTTKTEKICVAQHSNNCDFWVIGKPVGTLDYYAYAITSAGFNNTPVISSVGPAMDAHLGSLKSSPDSKIVTATHGSVPNGIHVYDFNNTTGVLTTKFSDTSPGGYSYSQEFSPDNKILYYALLNNSNIYQYDLTVANNTAFLASRQIIGTTANAIGYKMCALQIAANGKIYAALHGQTSLGVINSPNTLGPGCGYVDMQQSLGGRSSTLGLPAIVTSLIRPVNKIIKSDSCVKRFVQFGLLDTFKIVSYDWRFALLATPNVLIGTASVHNPVMQFNSTADYLLTAINHYACYTDTILDTLSILPLPGISLNPTNVSCFGLNDGAITAAGSGTTAPYTYSWSNASTTAVITGLAPIKYIVTVTDVKGCASQDSIVITSPAAALGIDNAFIDHVKCFGDATGDATIIAIGGTPPYSYSWNTTPVQTSQQATALIQGSYTCTVTDSNLCTVTQNVTITEPTKLITTITNSLSLCHGSSGSLNSTNTGGSGSCNYTWQPDGLTTQNITFSPTITANYVLTVKDQNNCIAKDSSMVYVNPNPVVNFGASAVCVGLTSVFTDSTTITSGTIATYTWTFGQGTAGSILQNPTYVYPICNSYTVSLTAISDSGCTSSSTKPLNVYCLPVAAFTVNNVCDYQQAAVQNTSTGASVYSWDFDHTTGIDDTSFSPTHTYSPGSYDVELIAITDHGCKDSALHSIDVYPQPLANFVADSVCLNALTQFTDLSTIAVPDNITSWQWDFDYNTGIDIGTQSPGKLYTQAGTHIVFLKVITGNGCMDTVIKNIIVYPQPDAQFSTANVCDGNNVHFTDISTIPTNNLIASRRWDFGDNSAFNTNQNTSHLYTPVGSYTVELLVVSNFGCEDSTFKIITVNPNPIIHFDGYDTIGCEPLCVFFLNLSYITTGSIDQWLWGFGDGSSSTSAQDLFHCYSNESVFLPNFFNVTVTATSDSGCVSTFSKNNYIAVYPKPDASFTVTPQTTTLTDPVISITDLSTGADHWNWNFGDGSDTTSALSSSTYTYADTGTYIVTLITSTQYNCIDTAYQTVIIEPDFLLYIPNAFTPDGDGINDSFSGKGVFIKKYEMTIFDRWGNLIYKTDDIDKPWDGKANHGGEIAQAEVYVYVIEALDLKDRKHKYKGLVTLLR
ncbi:MAG: PKD domain-containing protein [Bacteroidetes bacterium]|nr:PKD domain-containing protein [Bacteroidota bacterium]